MSFLIPSALAFLCALSGAAVGMALRKKVPAHHLSRDSIDVIKLATGLIATLVALVLGLLISSANSFRGDVENQYQQAMVDVGHLDQSLRAYGPETEDARSLLRRIVVTGARNKWPQVDFGPTPSVDGPIPDAALDLERRILRLHPADEEQKWFQSQALSLVGSLVRIQRLIANETQPGNLPIPVLVVVIICCTVIFSSFGLFTEPNPMVIAALSISALAVAGAIFLVVELNSPFGGLMQLPSAPLKGLLAMLGTR